MRKTIILLIVLASYCMLDAQNRQGNRQRGSAGSGPPKINIKGVVIDETTGKGLEFATISIFSSRDSSFIGGGLSDATGGFSVETKPGPMYGIIEFLGYENIYIDPIPFDREKLRSGNRTIDLGNLSIAVNSTTLDEIEIRAEKSETQFSLDKRIFNVGKDLANRGGTAEDILDNVPSVTVDIEGAVSLRGSEGVRILIDGRPSGLAGVGNANGLRNIPANMIDQVEVITNPSARYEAEGMAGIINIILKKEKGGGFNGSFDATIGYPEREGIGANLNYRKGPLNWFSNYSINHRTGPGSGFNYQERTVGDQVSILDSRRAQDRGGWSNSIRLGADYFITDKQQLTGTFLYRVSDDNNVSNIFYDSLSRNVASIEPQFLSQTIRTDQEKEDESNLEYSLNYRREFSARDHTLNALVQFRNQSEVESSDFNETFMPVGEMAIPSLIQQSNNDESEKTWLVQIDFTRPLGEGHKFELGYRGSFRDIGNDYLVEEQNSDGVFEPLFLNGQFFDNNFIYNEDIHAIYGIYGNTHGKFSYQLGLRGEYSHVITELVNEPANDRNYLNAFPSMHLNYKFSEGYEAQISYSKRVQRPRFWYLNPFFTLSDRINLFGGNPNLDPEYTDSYEIGQIKYWENVTLSSSLFYRHSEANIQRLRKLNDDGTTIRRPENLGTADDYGLDINLNYSGLKWLRLDANGNFFKATSNGFIDGKEFNVDNFTWFGRLTARITVWDSDFQIRSNYRGARQSAQGNRNGIGSVDLGWSKDFLNDKLTLTLSVRDLFNSRRRAGTTILENFFEESEFQWRARSSSLTASYRINQKKKRGRPRGGGDYQGGGEEF